MRGPVRIFLALLFLWPAATPRAEAQSRKFPGKLGAIVEKSASGKVTGTTFRVWAPHAGSVSVIGPFNDWNGQRDILRPEGKSGVWSADVRGAKPGDEYMFLINGRLQRKDPRARQVSSSDGRGIIYDPDAFDWGRTADWQSGASLSDLVIYQLHPGTFHDPDPADDKPGTLRDAMAKLDHLAKMGVNCVLLMPVNEFPGPRSWGYNPSDLFAVESAYGGPDALKEFVKACHERGIAVHLDVVHNHYGPDDLSLWQFDGYGGGDTKAGIYFYEDEERSGTPWGPRPDFGRPEVRDFIADQVRMWFDEYKIDGLRWDSTINIRACDNGARPNEDGERLLHRISRMIRREYPGKVSIAEDAINDQRFDSSWDYGWHHSGDHQGGIVPQLLKPTDADIQVGDIAGRIPGDNGFRRVIYTENHDETGQLNNNRRLITDADERDPNSLEARRKHALAAVLTLTTPGIPLVFMGQEILEDKEFHDSNALNWQRGEEAFHAFQLYRDLVHLRRNLDGNSPALTGTHARVVEADEQKKLLAYRRYNPGRRGEDIYVVVNFSGQPVKDHPLIFPQAGEWSVLLNTDDPKYGRGFSGTVTTKLRTDSAQKMAVSLAPCSAQIFGLTKVERPAVKLEEQRDAWDAAHGVAQEPEAQPSETGETLPAESTPEEGAAPAADANALVFVSNLTGQIPMVPVEENVWRCDMGFANAPDVTFKISETSNGREYGATSAEPDKVPLVATASEEGKPIAVRGPLNGDYSLTFNAKTLRYRFERRAASRVERMNVSGNFNGWSRGADAMHMTGDYTWEARVDLEPQEALEFVFVADGSLEKQWGDDTSGHHAIPAQGHATPMAQTIKIPAAAAGPHRFVFNEESGEYSVAPIGADEAAPWPDVPPPQPVTEVRRLPKP